MGRTSVKGKKPELRREEESKFELKFDFPPEVEEIIELVYGAEWTSTVRGNEINGVLGVAIIKSVIDGVNDDIEDIAAHLNTYRREIERSFSRLNMNGALLGHNLRKDVDKLKENDIHTWCHYAAIAAGHVGMYR